jgi:membrane-bound serine protease (ClpP class)
VRRLAITMLTASVGLGLFSNQSAVAQDEPAPEPAKAAVAPVDVLEISGLLDAIVADEIEQAIDRAESNGAQALILQMNSTQAIVSRDRMAEVAIAIRDSEIPVAIWVGPSGAKAYGLPGQLLGVAAVTGMAPGSKIGDFGLPLKLDGAPIEVGPESDRLQTETVGAEEAKKIGALKIDINDRTVPVMRNMVFALDGVTYNGKVLDTVTQVTNASGAIENQATVPTFYKLGLGDRLFHTVSSPPVAYLLFVIGLVLLIFEFYTAGVGVAGVVGVVCIVLATFGLTALPVRTWALGLLLVSLYALAVDVQVGIPRFWTGVGMLLFTVASIFLYTDGLRLSLFTLVVGVASTALAFTVGMPSMVRTRFATPTIGREWMIGEFGIATSDISPEGVVRVREATWRARTNRATPIAAGDKVRVASIDGITLEVEPETGAARDYREHGPRDAPADLVTDLTPTDHE